MNLEKRATAPGGGRPQNFFRMLLLALGPDGVPCTATEYLRPILPGLENQNLVTFHAAKLNNLMNCPDNPCDPDNPDERKAGKAIGKKIPKRWKRQKWLSRISDKRYQELWQLDQLLKREIPRGKVFYYDTENGRIVWESIYRPSVIWAKPMLATLEAPVVKADPKALIVCGTASLVNTSRPSPRPLAVKSAFQARRNDSKSKPLVFGLILFIAIASAIFPSKELKQSTEALYKSHISERQNPGIGFFYPILNLDTVRSNWKKRKER